MENTEDNSNDNDKIPVPNCKEDFTPEWCEWALKKCQTIGPDVTITDVEMNSIYFWKRTPYAL